MTFISLSVILCILWVGMVLNDKRIVLMLNFYRLVNSMFKQLVILVAVALFFVSCSEEEEVNELIGKWEIVNMQIDFDVDGKDYDVYLREVLKKSYTESERLDNAFQTERIMAGFYEFNENKNYSGELFNANAKVNESGTWRLVDYDERLILSKSVNNELIYQVNNLSGSALEIELVQKGKVLHDGDLKERETVTTTTIVMKK